MATNTAGLPATNTGALKCSTFDRVLLFSIMTWLRLRLRQVRSPVCTAAAVIPPGYPIAALSLPGCPRPGHGGAPPDESQCHVKRWADPHATALVPSSDCFDMNACQGLSLLIALRHAVAAAA